MNTMGKIILTHFAGTAFDKNKWSIYWNNSSQWTAGTQIINLST